MADNPVVSGKVVEFTGVQNCGSIIYSALESLVYRSLANMDFLVQNDDNVDDVAGSELSDFRIARKASPLMIPA